MDLDIILINYNSGRYLKNCLDAISKNNGLENKSITVCDNASGDDSISYAKKFFPNVCYINNDTNVGFASAINQVIKASKGDFILLLNPDVVLLPRAIDLMLEFMEKKPRCGIVGGEVLSPFGYHQPTCRRFPNCFNILFGRRSLARRIFPRNRFSNKYLYLNLDYTIPQRVDFVEGSVMMLRRKALDDVGLFDEDYFLYLEDADICYRMQKNGWETWWLPQAYAIHFRGENFRGDNIHPAMHHSKGFYRFFTKHYQPTPVVRALLRFFLMLRLTYVVSAESVKKVFHDTGFSLYY